MYNKNTANYPRLSTDKFFVDYSNEFSFNGYIDTAARFIEDFQLLNPELWARFVDQFRHNSDGEDAGWRGEYWGKMMRGACFTYSYTQNKELYTVLEKTVCDMIDSADADGRISSYARESDYDGWDLWGRKYVLLGMQYFLEISENKELDARIIDSMCAQVDYIMQKIGKKEDGKLLITKATRHWRGLNSSSILEPVVRLYTITGKQKYFDFAEYIVELGGTDVVNIFDLAYEDKFKPYQYPVTKAYEMTSCFEGLIEFYRHTKNERYLTSIVNFANSILETDFTIIGCCGCTSEYFDHSAVRQANTNNEKIMQETCVTVTVMKFFYQLTVLTGDSKYADAFETSLYNAYFGSINTEKVIEDTARESKARHPELVLEPLPFDSYSPLTAGTRGNGIGGYKRMRDGHYYGCCACIGSAGNGLAAKMALLTSREGLCMNLYFDGEIKTKLFDGTAVTLLTSTEYPKYGEVKITVNPEKTIEFTLMLRNPAWSKKTELFVNGESVKVKDGYIEVKRLWKCGDIVELSLDMRTEAVYPTPYGTQILMSKPIWGANYVIPVFDEEDPMAKHHVALRRGPVILAQDNRLGYSVDEPVDIAITDGYADVTLTENKATYKNIVEAEVKLTDGSTLLLTDYASAGKTLDERSKMAAWILTK